MRDLQLFTVTENIWCIRRRSYFTCSYLVKTSTGAVLVDAGMDSGGSDVRAALDVAGCTLEEVRGILLTHWHNDHAAGARALHDATGAPVFYHRDDAPYFTGETAHGGMRGRISDAIPEWGIGVLFKGLLGESTPRAVQADVFVNDGDVVLDDFEVMAAPGHTSGHVCFYYQPGKALFAGDALAVIEGRVRFMARPVTLNLKAARASMARVLKKEIALLCPGHREPLTQDVAARCREMLQVVESDSSWPLFG
jgi:glyoxylase-like metal-dependent hydrolase (beta-lactamase superfamily II)